MVEDNGNAQLLEINPRVTPTAHLLVEGACIPNRTVGLFPFELSRHPQPGVDVFEILDVPARAPLLTEIGTRSAARHHRLVPRAMRRVTQKGQWSRI